MILFRLVIPPVSVQVSFGQQSTVFNLHPDLKLQTLADFLRFKKGVLNWSLTDGAYNSRSATVRDVARSNTFSFWGPDERFARLPADVLIFNKVSIVPARNVIVCLQDRGYCEDSDSPSFFKLSKTTLLNLDKGHMVMLHCTEERVWWRSYIIEPKHRKSINKKYKSVILPRAGLQQWRIVDRAALFTSPAVMMLTKNQPSAELNIFMKNRDGKISLKARIPFFHNKRILTLPMQTLSMLLIAIQETKSSSTVMGRNVDGLLTAGNDRMMELSPSTTNSSRIPFVVLVGDNTTEANFQEAESQVINK